MAYFSIGTPISFSDLRDNFALSNPVSMENFRNSVYPYGPNLNNLGEYSSTFGHSLWRYQVRMNIGGAGIVRFNYPYASPGSTISVTSPWFRNTDYLYMTINAQPFPGYTFQYWSYPAGGGIFSYNPTTDVDWNQTTALGLIANFA
jgi:hypothetical protein